MQGSQQLALQGQKMSIFHLLESSKNLKMGLLLL